MSSPRISNSVNSASSKKDVIIIGAGLSGLSAAKELRANGLEVLVLEARERVGGRTLTKRDNANFWVDLGGSYVGPTQDSILNLIEELKLETYLVDDSLDGGYLRASSAGSGEGCERRVRFRPVEDPPLGNIFHWLDYVNMVRLIDSCGAQIPLDAPWNAAKAEEWDSMSWKQFVDANCWTGKVRDFFNNVYVTVDVCCDANEVSLLWFLWYVAQCGGFGRSISTTNGGQERKVANGTQQVSEKLREQLGKSRVMLSKPVCRIDQTSDQFVQVGCLDGSQFKASYVICALPPHLLLKIHHQPQLPSDKNLLAQRSPMGTVRKLILYYQKAFWKDAGFSGFFLFDAHSKGRALWPAILTLDETKIDGSHPAIIAFVAARGRHETRDKPVAELAKIVADNYATITKLDQFRDFVSFESFDWCEEQYSGGCYTSTHTMNTLTKYGQSLRKPFGRIHYAGTETAIKWSGYMDGAVSAGKRAAREILFAQGKLKDAAEVWQPELPSTMLPGRPFEYPESHKYAPSISSLLKVSQLLLASSLLVCLAYRRFWH